ncbi:hypothetical protein N7460_007307 [Penicillium canescens]|uniref:Uncharacterized protein n=1 Tax=Penicillium canescens TaxID=5083 RepID=A0AAD6IAJ6_PENCN|nr:hypothetical protein N7460_007307 [Penicillium canescens]
MPTDINADALPELESLAAWVSQIEMKEEKGKRTFWNVWTKLVKRKRGRYWRSWDTLQYR